MIYCFSTDEECFHDHCEAADVQAARQIAEEELALEPGQPYYVGIRKDVHPERMINADRLLEDIGDRLFDNVGELCEDWPDATTKQVADLEARLQAVLKQWMIDTACVPTFYQVEKT